MSILFKIEYEDLWIFPYGASFPLQMSMLSMEEIQYGRFFLGNTKLVFLIQNEAVNLILI